MRSYVVIGAFSLCLAFACRQSPKPEEKASLSETDEKGTAAPSAPAPAPGAPAQPAADAVVIDLLAHAVEPRDEDNPQSRLSLSVREPGKPEQQIELLTVTGGCNRLTGEETDRDALVTLRCWYAGAGDTLNAYREGDALVIRHQQSDEAEEAPLPVKELKRVPLPAGARVVTP